MNRTTYIVLAAVATTLLIAGGVIAWYSHVDESLFKDMSGQQLKLARSGTVMVRVTHYPKAPTNEIVTTGMRGRRWFMGRNVTLQQLMALAYNYNPGKVWLPPGAPKNNYDFIVTALSGPTEHLRSAIQKKTGYIASVETRDTDVLALVVKDRMLPGMKESGANERRDDKLGDDGRMYLTHQRPADIIEPIANVLKIPVIDKTGLSNYYDFSLEWTPKLQKGDVTQDDVEAILRDWGLGLQPDTASMEMLVVKKR